MTAENDLDRRIFEDQKRRIEREKYMSKAGKEPKSYGMRKLFK